MRARPRVCAMLGMAIGTGTQVAPVLATEILAEPPSDLIVTVYRAPYRNGGSIVLDDLQGFALISEMRIVHLPAGKSRLRFEGVADGIEPASAIVTGLPGGVIEKNRDARLLSPSALVASTLGKLVELLRTTRKTGKTERLSGTLLSDASGGLVFQTAQGIEALRCSGLPETFSFAPAADLSARPTLSVEVRVPRAETKQVTLSYLSRGFDWAADYTATLSADGKRVDLGAWVTLANANAVAFPSAHTQMVAGRVNREDGEVDPIDMGGPILARCWPRGSTSDMPMILRFERGLNFDSMKAMPASARAGSPMLQENMVIAAQKVTQEQLGDLKLYRAPGRTTLASRQSKQVRLMDRAGIPVATVYGADLRVDDTTTAAPAHRLLRTMNTAVNHLGLPLPSGTVAVFATHADQRLLEHESGMRDIAVNEELEIDMGVSPDVQVSAAKEHVEIRNARPTDVQFELRLQLEAGARVVRANQALGAKNSRPIFRFNVPANETVTVSYQIQRNGDRILRTP